MERRKAFRAVLRSWQPDPGDSGPAWQAGEASVGVATAPDARMLLVLEALHREAAVQLHLTQARAARLHLG